MVLVQNTNTFVACCCTFIRLNHSSVFVFKTASNVLIWSCQDTPLAKDYISGCGAFSLNSQSVSFLLALFATRAYLVADYWLRPAASVLWYSVSTVWLALKKGPLSCYPWFQSELFLLKYGG